MFSPADARRRWFGIFFLILAAGLLVWGQTLLKPHLKGVGFLFYWLLCFLFVVLAMVTALLDIRAMRRRTREEHRDLFQRTLDRIESDRNDPSGGSPS